MIFMNMKSNMKPLGWACKGMILCLREDHNIGLRGQALLLPFWT